MGDAREEALLSIAATAKGTAERSSRSEQLQALAHLHAAKRLAHDLQLRCAQSIDAMVESQYGCMRAEEIGYRLVDEFVPDGNAESNIDLVQRHLALRRAYGAGDTKEFNNIRGELSQTYGKLSAKAVAEILFREFGNDAYTHVRDELERGLD